MTGSRISNFKRVMQSGAPLVGTFVKTPSIEVIECLALAGLDFICLDAEHAPFDRARLDACLAIARALDFPALVRVGASTPSDILQALDSGAVGLVLPHVDTVEKAQALAKASRYGKGGRGYAGSSRWAGYTTSTMPDLIAKSHAETVVIAQIEEPEGAEVAAEIAAIDGIDGLFLGPADMTVGLGLTDQGDPRVAEVIAQVGDAALAAGKTYMTFVPHAAAAQDWAARFGFTMFFVASEQGWMMQGARSAVAGIKGDTAP